MKVAVKTQEFRAWLKDEIKKGGSVDSFIRFSGKTSVYAWVSGWRVPPPHQRAELAVLLSQWIGRKYTEKEINNAIDPSWNEISKTFAEWLTKAIQHRGSINSFGLNYGFQQSAIREWTKGIGFPLGRVGQLNALSAALSDWTERSVTVEELRSLIESDPSFAERSERTRKKIKSASVEVTTSRF